MKTLLILFLLSLPAYFGDRENYAERYERVETLASAIDSATLESTCTGPFEGADWCEPVWGGTREELAALLVSIGFYESTFARHVQSGECRSWECDLGRAHGIYQQRVGPWLTHEEAEALKGTGYMSAVLASVAASRVLGAGLKRCRSAEATIAFYGVHRCRWDGAASRLQVYRRALAAFR